MYEKIVNSKKLNHGFTIIEVLIVLAIAGLILLIVFLAVPALQRNSRNTQYRTEAARLMAAAREYSLNSQGYIPQPTLTVSCSGSGGAVGNCDDPNPPSGQSGDPARIWQLAKLRIIDIMVIRTVGTGPLTVPSFINRVVFQSGAKCGTISGLNSHNIVLGVAPGSFILVYAIENSDGTLLAQCIDS